MWDAKMGHSVDLEWLLQSGEASQDTIITYLLHEMYFPVYQLTFAILGMAEPARQAAQEVMAEALLHPRDYRGDTPVLEWLDQLALKTLQLDNNKNVHPDTDVPYLRDEYQEMAVPLIPVSGIHTWSVVQDMAVPYRLVFILNVLRGLSPLEISYLLHIPLADAEARLEIARKIVAAECGLDVHGVMEMDSRIERSFQTEWDKIAPAEPDWEELKRQVKEQVRKKSARRRFLSTARQALFVGLALILLVGFILVERGGKANSTRLPASVRNALATATATVLASPTSMATPSQTAVPFDGISAAEQIKQKIINSSKSWHTLWADAEIIYYGPSNFVGPAQVFRNQVWIDQPAQTILLAGEADLVPQYLRLIDEKFALEADLVYQLSFEKDLYALSLKRISYPYLYTPWEAISSASPPQYGFYLDELLQPSEAWWPSGKFTVVGSSSIAGRRVQIVRWQSDHQTASARIWVDAQTGMIFRLWLYNHENPYLVDMEIRLTNVVLDAQFPAEFFTLKTGWFENLTWDSVWRPGADHDLLQNPGYSSVNRQEVFPLVSPRPKLDLYNAQLTFQWSAEQPTPSETPRTTDLFLDGYWIGQVDMGDPWSISCERSANGRYVAFARGYTSDYFSSDGLGWIDLQAANEAQQIFPQGIAGGDFAISPDSERIAYAGCLSDGTDCAVYIYEPNNHSSRRLATLENAGAFAWSPDGQELAVVGIDPTGTVRKWELMVFQVSTGAVLYRAEADPHQIEIPADAPILSWGIQYPPAHSGLEGCQSADTQNILKVR